MIYDSKISFLGSPNDKGAIKLVLESEDRESDHTTTCFRRVSRFAPDYILNGFYFTVKGFAKFELLEQCI